MRLLLLVLFILPSLALAGSYERDQRMAQLLEENKVEPYGKRQAQWAEIYCSKSRKKHRELTCSIAVPGPGLYAPNSVYEKLRGERAQELSELLLEFGAYPEGKREVQRADIRCRYEVKKLPASLRCEILPSWPY